MSEKLASAEIDESRDRFEKAMGSMPAGTPYCEFDIWQAAERDTRERIAQQIVEEWNQGNHNPHVLAERIRGVNR